jgi:hypothetical protein
MAGNFSNEGENLVLEMLLRNNALPPEQLHLGLSTSPVDDESTLSSITEEDDANYVRQPVNFTAPVQVSGRATCYNTDDIQFGPWDVEADSAVTHAFLTDQSSGTTGKLIAWFPLPDSKQPLAGETLSVPTNDFIFDLD